MFSSENQNSEENLSRLAAQRYLYSSAKKWIIFQYISIICLTVLGIIGALKYGFPVTAISFTFLLIDSFLVERFIRGRLRDAALIQEDFDCNVQSQEWSKTKCSSKVPMEDVYRYSKNMDGNLKTQKLRDWYPKVAFTLPVEIGRLICQRANIVWNTSGRKRFQWVLNTLVIVSIVLLFVSCFYSGMEFQKWALAIFVPSLPFLNRLRDVWQKSNDSIARIVHLQSRIQEVWSEALSGRAIGSKLTEQSREIQTELFDFRSRELPIFDKLYWTLRNEDEKSMTKTAESLVRDAVKSLGLQTH